MSAAGGGAPEAGAAEAPGVECVSIASLAAGGDGVGRLSDGRAVFVPLAAPGDRLRIRVTESKRRYARAEIVHVEQASPSRRAPRCIHFGTCGGCTWQHVEYAAQLEAKREIVTQALRRIGKLEGLGAVELHASPTEYGYRARARLVAGEAGLGYRRRASHEAVPVRECPILVPELEAALASDDEIGTVQPGGEVELCAGVDGVRASRLEGNHWSGDPLWVALGDDRLRVSPGVFTQANIALRARLEERVFVNATADLGPGAHVLELYAGAGFFTLRLARAVASLVAIEAGHAAADDLVRNLANAGASNVRVVAEPVETAIESCGEPRPDVIVLDPPRTGLPRTVAALLAAIDAPRIVYVSCDPATLARDIAAIREVEPTYRSRRVEIFDLFPQTPHVEAMVVLERQSRPGGSDTAGREA